VASIATGVQAAAASHSLSAKRSWVMVPNVRPCLSGGPAAPGIRRQATTDRFMAVQAAPARLDDLHRLHPLWWPSFLHTAPDGIYSDETTCGHVHGTEYLVCVLGTSARTCTVGTSKTTWRQTVVPAGHAGQTPLRAHAVSRGTAPICPDLWGGRLAF
jgi:hypothetical protein